MRKISNVFVREERDMPDDLMDNIRLRRVFRIGRMPNVLSRTEDPMRKGVQKLSLAEDSMSRPDAEMGFGI